MVKLSIIVPVYNVEEYLDKCLSTLVNQTLDNYEVIVVNDGTRDNSQKIIDKYTRKYKFVKSYIKENGGQSSARNYGLKYAKGEYITFVDSDDYVDLNMYEDMYNKAKSKDFDMVVCNLRYVYPDKETLAYSNINKDIFTKKDIKKTMINVYPSVWNKIYKHSLFDNNVYFKENVWFEDVEFIYRLYPYINSIGVVGGHYYYYIQRNGSIMKTFDERVFHYVENWNGLLDFYKENNFYDEYKKEIEYSYVRYLYATFIKTASNFKDRSMFDKAVNMAKMNVLTNFPNYRRNLYFYSSLKGIYLVFFNKFLTNLIYKRKNGMSKSEEVK